jgi:CubicO group peptidase (beta-lactamase class C family)
VGSCLGRLAIPVVACMATASPGSHAATEPIDQRALERLVARAESAGSDALVVVKNGELVGEWYFGKPRAPIEAMSVTKSVVSLAIGRLIDTGRIASVDTPVHSFYPEWKQGRKQRITVRHILDHTSGLQDVTPTTVEIYPSPDLVQLALAAELTHDPGTQFAYNNKAVNLLAGIVKLASGRRMDAYIGEEIFAPLGITDYSWTRDAAGNPHVMAGLQIRALDLAKLGQLVANRGTWHERRIVSEIWIEQSFTPRDAGPFAYARPRGFLWWLIPAWERTTLNDDVFEAWRAAELDDEFIAKVLPLKDRVYESGDKRFFVDLAEIFGGEAGLEVWYDNTWRRGLPDSAILRGPIVAYMADGYLGQALVVVPDEQLVVVRQRRAPAAGEDTKQVDSFPELARMVLAL